MGDFNESQQFFINFQSNFTAELICNAATKSIVQKEYDLRELILQEHLSAGEQMVKINTQDKELLKSPTKKKTNQSFR